MPEFPTALWDGNTQDTANDGPANPLKAQAADYNESADEVIAVQDTLRKGYVLEVRNQTGGLLAEGTLVRITGVDAGNIPIIVKAIATSSTTFADGVIIGDIADGAIGNIATAHIQNSTNTTPLGAPGTPLFLSDTVAGTVTATAPGDSQRVGSVAKQDISGLIYFSLATGGGGGAAGVGAAPTEDDKAQNPTATAGDNASTGVTIMNTPSGDSYVEVLVNGVQYELGDGVKTKDTYFSNDGGTTARTIETISSNDELFWNGNIAGFDLVTTDEIDFNYNVGGAVTGGGPPSLHAATHSENAPDEVKVEDLGSAETDTTLHLAPDGLGGLAFVSGPALTNNDVTTTGNTETTIATIAIPDNTILLIIAHITARRTDAADRAAYIRRAVVFRESAGVATLLGPVDSALTRESTGGWNATIDVDGGNNARIRIEGDAGNTVKWHSEHFDVRIS